MIFDANTLKSTVILDINDRISHKSLHLTWIYTPGFRWGCGQAVGVRGGMGQAVDLCDRDLQGRLIKSWFTVITPGLKSLLKNKCTYFRLLFLFFITKNRNNSRSFISVVYLGGFSVVLQDYFLYAFFNQPGWKSRRFHTGQNRL